MPCSAWLRIRLIPDLKSLSALILAQALYCRDWRQDPLSECLLRALIAFSLRSISFSSESVSLRRRLRPIWSLCGTGAPTTIIPLPQLSGIFSCFSSQSNLCVSEVEKRNLHKMTKLARSLNGVVLSRNLQCRIVKL